MFRSICLSAALAASLLWSGCRPAAEVPVEDVVPVIEPVATRVVEVEVERSDIRMVGEDDLVRVREQHAGLIASIPTPTPYPTVSAAERASVYVLTGEDAWSEERENLVSDPSLGIWWYRNSGGDWTTSRTRGQNPYSPLFYSSEYGAGRPNFERGSMQELIAQQLAQGAEVLLPEISGRAASLVSPLTRNLGWEIASDVLPVVRVWSSFTYLGPLDDSPRQYRVGGVLSFAVNDELDRDSGDVLYQYLVMDHFLGNGVILEDAGPLEDRG